MFTHMSPEHFSVKSCILEEMLAWSGILQEMSFFLLMSSSLHQQPPTRTYPLELLTAIFSWISAWAKGQKGLQVARDPMWEGGKMSQLYILLLKYLSVSSAPSWVCLAPGAKATMATEMSFFIHTEIYRVCQSAFSHWGKLP